ncbi:2-hydroxyacid dehydrogenase [Glutamicibacter sp. MNS18]|uniref:2-hydroxyacid dehydrogenase n=1 Tax=Glutamicibacter sp. MNS18 TaxID=2989817 RepID=UPI002235DDD8|nr:2-hydroxyacid dehydrogenase [Glutamicibacter sp. MNS18]MCW4465653.1 2-hydroxyacid dehydrogenase [Glutamicibacter sp. MNS18]
MVTGLKVVVTDPIVSRLEPLFRELGPDHEWHFVAGQTDREQDAAIASAQVLVCSRLTAEQAASCTASLVHITGSGTDRVALSSLPKDTVVARTAHHERSIAEHVLMVILAHQRRLLQVTGELRNGVWKSVATENSTAMHRSFRELRIGFVGLGGIGRQALELCAAMGASCVAVKRTPREDDQSLPGLEWVKPMGHLPRLLETSDVVVLGVPLTEDTRGMIGVTELHTMRDGALLVNVSRGAVVDPDALYEALVAGRIGGAALDVWWDAPEGSRAPDDTQRFSALPNVIATPHYSGHSLQTFRSRVTEITTNINAFSARSALANTAPGISAPDYRSAG